jgi:hypothetical protein
MAAIQKKKKWKPGKSPKHKTYSKWTLFINESNKLIKYGDYIDHTQIYFMVWNIKCQVQILCAIARHHAWKCLIEKCLHEEMKIRRREETIKIVFDLFADWMRNRLHTVYCNLYKYILN